MVDRKSKQEISELVKKIESSRDSLPDLVQDIGLDPQTDLMGIDLRGSMQRSCDLGSFNLERAQLQGSKSGEGRSK